ncbi:MAG TPA: flavin reductase family protein [Aliidongia sp.]|uniref:flavin reductase family protein n=1 Tax=Aliidongia sp. TaxID=1914230 RepID=UPI002DDCC1B8|nr:flavin reductase family protein [Aliidongia sp.]HEV2673061.1 flavin reductase family protein [Aliidongia sp.]
MRQADFDTTDLRRAFGTFLTGVTVVTTRDESGAPCGMTANSFTSVSLDPPLVLVCIGNGSSNITAFEATDRFAVNILGHDQTDVATVFSARGVDRFATIVHEEATTGAPILTDCLGWFDCRLHQRVIAGDHLILIGYVEDLQIGQRPPLGFCRGRFVNLDATVSPGMPAK